MENIEKKKIINEEIEKLNKMKMKLLKLKKT